MGNRISGLLESLGFSNSRLARELGVSRSLVGKWLSNKNRPSPDHIEKMASLFGVSSAFIAGFEETGRIDPVAIANALKSAKVARVELDAAISALESIGGGVSQKDNVTPLYRAADGGLTKDKEKAVRCAEEAGQPYEVGGKKYEQGADLGDSGESGSEGHN